MQESWTFGPILQGSKHQQSRNFTAPPYRDKPLEEIGVPCMADLQPVLLGSVVYVQGVRGRRTELEFSDYVSWGGLCPGARHVNMGCVAALQGGKFWLSCEFSLWYPRKEKKCLPPSYRLQALSSVGDYINLLSPWYSTGCSSVGGKESSSEQGHSEWDPWRLLFRNGTKGLAPPVGCASIILNGRLLWSIPLSPGMLSLFLRGDGWMYPTWTCSEEP